MGEKRRVRAVWLCRFCKHPVKAHEKHKVNGEPTDCKRCKCTAGFIDWQIGQAVRSDGKPVVNLLADAIRAMHGVWRGK